MRRPRRSGLAARRALARWAIRLFRREWRQQILVAALLTAGTAATVFTATAAANISRSPDSEMGHANHRIELSVRDPEAVPGYVAAAEAHFGTIELIFRTSAPVPGSIESIEVRSQDPNGTYSSPMRRLLAGRFANGPDEVALTDRASDLFDASLGETIPLGDNRAVVVGIVENPGDLDDEFALAAPSTVALPEHVTILFDASEDDVDTFRPAVEPGPLFIADAGRSGREVAAVGVMVISIVGMLLIGLVASAGFVVIAQRRQRQLGMLAAIGATPRHLRVVVLTNGAVVGALAAIAGVGAGFGGWILFAPTFEGIAGHRINRFDLPLWLIAAGVVLAVGTATVSAWWPARAIARVPIVSALSARPPRRVASHRSMLAAVVLLGAGVVCLALAIKPDEQHVNPVLMVGGLMAMIAAVVSMASPLLNGVASTARRLPIASRLAVRDLARNQARSAAALAAMTLGLAISVSVVVVAAAAEYRAGEGNLSERQLVAWVGDEPPDIFVPERSADALETAGSAVEEFTATLDDAKVVRLDVAVDPTISERRGTEVVRPFVALGRRVGSNTTRFSANLYLATPAALAYLGVSSDRVGPETVVLTEQEEPAYVVGDIRRGSPFAEGPVPAESVERIDAPPFGSAPRALITERALRAGEWQAATAGWLIESARPLTSAQRAAARDMAADAGLTIESRDQQPGLAALRTGASLAGVVLALGILAMTIGLLRAETAGDLRTLSAAGASGRVRRALAATTAGTLAAAAVVSGIVTAYLALLAGYWPKVGPLGNVPVTHLVALVVALPVLAAAGSWVLAGREPPAIARQPMA